MVNNKKNFYNKAYDHAHVHEYGNIPAQTDAFLELKIPKNANILEIGCNTGRFLDSISQQGYSYLTGLDISDTAISRSVNKKMCLVSYDGKKIPFADELFDIVLSFDVIEHIPDAQKHFHEVHRILRPGGTYFFQTPNKYINACWSTIESKSFVKWKEYHCSLHSISNLKDRARESGFKVLNFSKKSLLTSYNKKKIVKQIGFAGIPILYLVNSFPLSLAPNIWGNFQKYK